MKHLNQFEKFFEAMNEGQDAQEIGRVKFGTNEDIVVKRAEHYYVITQKSKIVPSKVNTIVITDDVLEEFLDIFRTKNGAGEA